MENKKENIIWEWDDCTTCSSITVRITSFLEDYLLNMIPHYDASRNNSRRRLRPLIFALYDKYWTTTDTNMGLYWILNHHSEVSMLQALNVGYNLQRNWYCPVDIWDLYNRELNDGIFDMLTSGDLDLQNERRAFEEYQEHGGSQDYGESVRMGYLVLTDKENPWGVAFKKLKKFIMSGGFKKRESEKIRMRAEHVIYNYCSRAYWDTGCEMGRRMFMNRLKKDDIESIIQDD